jgi:hypothetical protein
MAVGAALFLFAGPWLCGLLLFRSRPGQRAAAHAWSLVLNCLALLAVLLLLRNTAGIERVPFCGAWLAWTCLLGIAAARGGECGRELVDLWRLRRGDLGLALLAAVIGMGVFRAEHFEQCFNGDGIESHELAASLREHFLPTWQIETSGEFGPVIVNPALVNSYWTCAAQVLLGDGEFAARLPYWVYWVGIVLACNCLLADAGAPRLRRCVLLLVMTLWTVWYTFYVGYDAYMADPANPGVPDALFTLLFVLWLDSLRRGDAAAWVACMLCASLVLYAGPALFALTVAAGLMWPPIERARFVRAAAAGAAGLLLMAGGYVAWGWHLGLLGDWRSTLEAEYVREYFAPLSRGQSGALFAGYFVLGCGGLPAWGVVRAWRGTHWERCVAAVVLGYLAVILGAAVKNLHYLGPLVPVVVVLWGLRPSGGGGGGGGARWADRAALLTAAVSLIVSWPRARPVFTLTRELGSATTLQASTYEEACRLAEQAVIYDLGVVSWEVGPHTWVYYSAREAEPASTRPLLVTRAAEAPPGYEYEARSPFGVRLLVTDEDWLTWARSRRPLIGPERAPAVYQPIAIRPRPRLVYRVPE